MFSMKENGSLRRTAAVRKVRLAAIVVSAVLVAACPGRADMTLTSSVAEVVVNDLAVGKRYSLSAAQRAPMRIRYSGPAGVVVRVEPVHPSPEALRPGYEPIPRLKWVRVIQRSFAVSSSPARFETDVTVRLPRRKRYRDRKYQFNLRIFVEPMDGPKGSLSVALENRFLVSTRP